ncbi:hypothetical protein BKA65DRAFT_604976 [Rhexocercosporidium sp. MPI-PUGE-AT-0058]|nr:hypothetical protein BKA65DRAFT_604976 [Rhexocercosporidium sp. MPI-PUGE-AT-0058]
MFSIFRAPSPTRTNNAYSNPVIYDGGLSSVEFHPPSSKSIMTHRLPPTNASNGNGRGLDPRPFILSSAEDATRTACIPAGQYHRFENASQDEDLVVDRLFRNFFGYLDDCKTANTEPSLFQLLVFLRRADTPLALHMPTEWFGRIVRRAFLVVLATGVWIIYIHGGAWRDPLVTADSFISTVKSLTTNHSSIFTTTTSPTDNKPFIAGMASINYSLTPKTAANAKNDTSHRAKHPDHILDVLTALEYLQAKVGFGEKYVLMGHSCGATLALQVAMGGREKWLSSSSSTTPISNSSSISAMQVKKPIVIVGLNGLYDMPTLIRSPGEKHQQLQALYEEFTRRAFGDDEAIWKEISPVYVEDWGKAEWVMEGKKARQVVLVQSREDSQVSYWQLGAMRKSLLGGEANGNEALEVKELKAIGEHNDLWKEGTRLAEIVVDVMGNLM